MANIVFILGAGASAAGGCPVMSTFIETAARLTSGIRDDSLRFDFQSILELTGFLQQLPVSAGLDPTNIEALISYIDMMELSGSPLGGGVSSTPTRENINKFIAYTIDMTQEFLIRHRMRDIGSLLAQQRRESRLGRDPSAFWINHGRHNFCSASCGELSTLGHWDISGPADYAKLFSILHKLMLKDPTLRASFITFNYDLGLDFACESAGFTIDYGFRDPVFVSMMGESEMIICKPHGSLNWSYAPGFESPNTPVPDFSPLDAIHVPSYLSCPVKANLRSVRVSKTNRVDPPRIPWIVPPSESKASLRGPIKEVWRTARVLLKCAHAVIICGYSMPSSDGFFRYFLAHSLAEASTPPVIIVINSGGKPEHPAFIDMRTTLFSSGLFDHSKFVGIHKSFMDGLDDLPLLLCKHALSNQG